MLAHYSQVSEHMERYDQTAGEERMKPFILACVAALATTDAIADPMADLIGSKTYWQSMAWEKAEQSKIWKMSGWGPSEGKQETGRTFAKERQVEIDGKNLRAYLIVEEAPTRQNELSIYSTELSPDECEQIGNWLVRKFGQPKLVVDGSYKFDLVAQGNTVESIDKMSQWDIGSTRTTFTCAGLKKTAEEKFGEKNKLSGILVFGSKASEREIKPLFGLRCTQQYKIIGVDRAPANLNDITIIIDENRKRVRSANKIPFPGEHQITEGSIELKMKKGDDIIEFSIDRLTGVYKGKSRSLKGGGKIDVSGRCEKMTVGERKF